MLGNANWEIVITNIRAHIPSTSQGKIGLICSKDKGFGDRREEGKNNLFFFFFNLSFRGGSSLSRWDPRDLGEQLHGSGTDNRK